MEIPLKDGTFAYGVALGGSFVRYHDRAWAEPMDDIDTVLATPVLVVLSGATEAIREKRWRKLGETTLRPEERRIPDVYIRSSLPPHEYTILGEDGMPRPATAEECEGLEPAEVYRPEHVEERLNEHFAKTKSRRRPAN